MFDNLASPASRRDKMMAAAFGAYWSNFGHTGNPAAGGAVPHDWPIFRDTGLATEKTAILDVPVSLQSDFMKGKCDFWDKLDPQGRGHPQSTPHNTHSWLRQRGKVEL